MPIQIVPYNPDWPKRFETEAISIRSALRHYCLAIHHIGSTSIPGLAAKDALDVLCVVDRLSSSRALEQIGYTFRGEQNIPLRYYYVNKAGPTRVNLHVVEPDHGFIALNLCFRDYMLAHPKTVEAYRKLKTKLIADPASHEKSPNRFSGYNLGKDRFIKKVLDDAGFDGVIANFCMHDEEWETYHRIRTEQLFAPIGVVYDRNHPSITAPLHYHFVLYHGTRIVSVGMVEFLNDHEAALRSLATDEPYKKQSYGTQMIRLLERWISSQGRRRIKLHAALDAEGFYRRRGYVDMEFDEPSLMPEYVNLGKDLK